MASPAPRSPPPWARLGSAWLRFWFEAGDARDLGIARALFGALFFLALVPSAPKWPVWPWSAPLWTEVSPVFWHPVGVFRLLGLGVAPAPVLVLIWVLFYLGLLCSTIGLWTRPSLWVTFALGFYVTNLRNNFGKIDWNWELPPIIFLLLAASRAGDAFSLDAWLARRRRAAPSSAPPPSAEYRWPLQAIRVWLALAYFAAGVSKLRNGGLDWFASDTLGVYLVRSNYPRIFAANQPVLALGLWVAQHHWMVVASTLITLIIECGYPLALFSRRARWLLVPGAVMMHIGILLLIGAYFLAWIAAAVFWVPWGALVERLRAGRWPLPEQARGGAGPG